MLLIQNPTPARLAKKKVLVVFRECCIFAPSTLETAVPLKEDSSSGSAVSAFKVIELFDEGLFEFSPVVIPSSSSISLFHKYTFSHNPHHEKVFCILLQATKISNINQC